MRRLATSVVAVAALWLAPGALGAGWCGNGEVVADRPDLGTGAEVHVVYALPSDGVDRFAQLSNQIADDAAAIESWWTTQDPTREPRFDTGVFPACTGLDITFLRLEVPSSALGAADGANDFVTVAGAGFARGFRRDYKKYLVYWDGPSTRGICGTSNGEFLQRPSWSIVWLQGCPTVDTNLIAAHELLHALGALPEGAPNSCSPRDRGHPCDDPRDILWPQSNGLTLAQKLLDVNHDDYYAHAGSWHDIQDSVWLRRLDAQQLPLTVAFSGAGRVTSDVPGVDCSAACTTTWDAGSVTRLTAVPAGGTRFVAWRGACLGRGDCQVSIAAPTTVTAVYGPLRVPARVATLGRGTVACSPRCSPRFKAGDQLTLRAVPATGWRFTGWSGACKGARPVCRPATDFAVSARASFRPAKPS